MITQYLEITTENDCKLLIPIESIKRVGQFKETIRRMQNGLEINEDILKTRLQVEDFPVTVKEPMCQLET